ncbi:MAG: site-specific DNA-methyltransferase [Patescibacteria group bacterium]|nr:site-specific DNA-methyltransferase [Patescibacteria group bacterium]
MENDVLKLMGDEKADMCLTDPPYLLDYLKGKKKKNGEVTKGFGLKRDRVYLGTETLPDNFTELWMNNVAKIQKPDFSIIVYENPKNLRTIWNELEKHWKYRNTIIWHIPNRVQGFSAKYKLFNKHDFAIVGTSGKIGLNTESESDELLQTEYETALFATSGSPQWESYGKGKKYCPTDFIEHIAADEKSSGQGIIFGTKPLEILIPYIKVMTRRDALIVEPFGGSGSTLIAAQKMNRRCFLMEKSPVYAEVIKKRWENLTNLKAEKI